MGRRPGQPVGQTKRRRVADVLPILHRRCTPPTGVVNGHLVVTCWCDTELVWVPEKDVMNGRTRSCGNPECCEVAVA